MVVHNEVMTLPDWWWVFLVNEKCKLSGNCSVSSQHNVKCWSCLEMKLCWGVLTSTPKRTSIMSYFCDECKKKLFEKDTATVSVEKANGES